MNIIFHQCIVHLAHQSHPLCKTLLIYLNARSLVFLFVFLLFLVENDCIRVYKSTILYIKAIDNGFGVFSFATVLQFDVIQRVYVY